jgi:hypothetical protein
MKPYKNTSVFKENEIIVVVTFVSVVVGMAANSIESGYRRIRGIEHEIGLLKYDLKNLITENDSYRSYIRELEEESRIRSITINLQQMQIAQFIEENNQITEHNDNLNIIAQSACVKQRKQEQEIVSLRRDIKSWYDLTIQNTRSSVCEKSVLENEIKRLTNHIHNISEKSNKNSVYTCAICRCQNIECCLGCGHAFCNECTSEIIKQNNDALCPICREPILNTKNGQKFIKLYV